MAIGWYLIKLWLRFDLIARHRSSFSSTRVEMELEMNQLQIWALMKFWNWNFVEKTTSHMSTSERLLKHQSLWWIRLILKADNLLCVPPTCELVNELEFFTKNRKKPQPDAARKKFKMNFVEENSGYNPAPVILDLKRFEKVNSSDERKWSFMAEPSVWGLTPQGAAKVTDLTSNNSIELKSSTWAPPRWSFLLSARVRGGGGGREEEEEEEEEVSYIRFETSTLMMISSSEEAETS